MRTAPAACPDATASSCVVSGRAFPTNRVSIEARSVFRGARVTRNGPPKSTPSVVARASLSTQPATPNRDDDEGGDASASLTESLSGLDSETATIDPAQKQPASPKSAFVLAGSLALVATVLYLTCTYTSMGAGVYKSLSKSGFTAAFALIFVSELGDKTFFIAALLAMRLGRFTVLAGATSALCLMSVISVVIGRLCQKIPSSINDTLPIGEYLAVGLLFYFGIRTLMEALSPPEKSGADGETTGTGELADAEEFVAASEQKKKLSPSSSEKNFLGKFWETFTLVFIAEWGDRSMLATIALGAAQNPVGVTFGACFGHLLATLIAVIGGALLSKRISERTVGITGGVLFIGFAFATLAGVF